MFAGIHAKKKAHIRISKAALKYPYLSSWYDGPNSVSMLNQDESVPEPSMEVTDVTDEIKFSFVSEFHKWPIKFGISYQINFEKLLEIQYSLPKGFDTLLRDAVLFSKLLEFSIRKKIQFKVLGISVDPTDLLKVDDRMQSNGLLYVPITYFGSYSDNELIDKHEVHQNFMLISSWVLSKEAINNVVKKWFSNEGYFHIYDYYLDSHNWFEGTGAVLTSVMFNGRFLNLIQALESYHKKLDSTYKQNADGFRNQKARIADFIKSDNDLMAWFNNVLKGPPENFSLQERLQDLLSKIDPIIVSLFSTNKVFSSFPREAKDYRHKLSHGDLDGTDLGRPLVKLFYQAQLILSILILASLDFSESEILRIVRHNQNFIRDINEIIHNHKNP